MSSGVGWCFVESFSPAQESSRWNLVVKYFEHLKTFQRLCILSVSSPMKIWHDHACKAAGWMHQGFKTYLDHWSLAEETKVGILTTSHCRFVNKSEIYSITAQIPFCSQMLTPSKHGLQANSLPGIPLPGGRWHQFAVAHCHCSTENFRLLNLWLPSGKLTTTMENHHVQWENSL